MRVCCSETSVFEGGSRFGVNVSAPVIAYNALCKLSAGSQKACDRQPQGVSATVALKAPLSDHRSGC